MNDPIDSAVATEMSTVTVPSTVSGALVLRINGEGIVTLLVLGRGVTWEVYGPADDVVRGLLPHMTRRVMTRGKRTGQPYLIGRGTVTVDPAEVGREATPDEYGTIGIAIVAAAALPAAKPAADDIRAAFA